MSFYPIKTYTIRRITMRDTDTIIDGVGAIVLCVMFVLTVILSFTIDIPVAETVGEQIHSPPSKP